VRGVRRALDKDTAQTHIVFGTDTIPYADRRKYGMLVISNVFGGGMSSRLFQRIREELVRLARETAEWLEGRQLAGRTVTIKVRYADFTTVTRSHTLSRPTADADVISSWATELLHRTQAGRRPVRLLGARVSNILLVALPTRFGSVRREDQP